MRLLLLALIAVTLAACVETPAGNISAGQSAGPVTASLAPQSAPAVAASVPLAATVPLPAPRRVNPHPGIAASLPATPPPPATTASVAPTLVPPPLPGPVFTGPTFTIKERDPGRLLDLGRPDLASILGMPTFIRRDMSAEVWQYRTDTCVLDVFLYETEQQFAVTYYEFRARRDTALVRDRCFLSLLLQGKADRLARRI